MSSGHVLQPIIDEQQRRTLRSSRVPVITLNAKRGGKAIAAGVPGTIHVILTRKGSGVIDSLTSGLNAGEEQFNQAMQRLIASYRRKKPVSVADMVKLTVKQPIFADLRSGGERLQSGLFVPPGTDAIYLGYPYNGGPLPSRGFELVEHIADGSTDVALEAIALKCDPVLTRAEAAALKIMPKDQIAKNIGASSDCDTTYLLLGRWR